MSAAAVAESRAVSFREARPADGRTLFAIARAHAALGVGVEAERALSQAIAAFGAAGESSAQDYARALAWRDEQRRL